MTSDEELIRRAVAEYCQFLDDRRFEDWVARFAEDGSFNEHKGRDAIRTYIMAGELATQPDLRRKHAATNIVMEIDGDRADVLCDFIMFDARGDGPWQLVAQWRCVDKMVKQGGEWLIAERRTVR